MSSLTKGELYSIFKQCKPTFNKPPDLDEAVKLICEKLGLSEDMTLKADIQKLLWSFNKFRKKQANASSNSRNVDMDMSEVVLLREDYCAAPSSLPPPVKKRKSFTNVSRQMQRIKTDQILEVLNNFIDCEKENDDECELTVTQLLGFLIYHINYVNNREVANLGLSIFEQKVNEKPSFDNLDAISLMHDLTLTKTQMRNVKSYLKQKDVYFPNTTDLLQPRKEVKPVIHTELDGDGVSVDYKS